jgi:hypothetical protein
LGKPSQRRKEDSTVRSSNPRTGRWEIMKVNTRIEDQSPSRPIEPKTWCLGCLGSPVGVECFLPLQLHSGLGEEKKDWVLALGALLTLPAVSRGPCVVSEERDIKDPFSTEPVPSTVGETTKTTRNRQIGPRDPFEQCPTHAVVSPPQTKGSAAEIETHTKHARALFGLSLADAGGPEESLMMKDLRESSQTGA